MVKRADSLVPYVSFDKKLLKEEGLFEIRLPAVDFASAIYKTKLRHVWDIKFAEMNVFISFHYWLQFWGYWADLLYVLNTEVYVLTALFCRDSSGY